MPRPAPKICDFAVLVSINATRLTRSFYFDRIRIDGAFIGIRHPRHFDNGTYSDFTPDRRRTRNSASHLASGPLQFGANLHRRT